MLDIIGGHSSKISEMSLFRFSSNKNYQNTGNIEQFPLSELLPIQYEVARLRDSKRLKTKESKLDS